MARPVHLEIRDDGLERAKTFYADVFGRTSENYGPWPARPTSA